MTEERTAHIDVEWGEASDVPDGVIRATVENVCEMLMAQLVAMGVTDPDISATLNGRQCAFDPRSIAWTNCALVDDDE